MCEDGWLNLSVIPEICVSLYSIFLEMSYYFLMTFQEVKPKPPPNYMKSSI